MSEWPDRIDHWLEGQLYGMDGEPITAREWREYVEHPERKRVAWDEIEGVRISTVLLVLDHNFGFPGPPLIFETMIFGLETLAEEQWRYSTREEAEEGHRRAVELVRLELAIVEGPRADGPT